MLAQVYETSLVLDELQDQRLTIHHIFVLKYLFDSYDLSSRLYLGLYLTKMGRKIRSVTDISLRNSSERNWHKAASKGTIRAD